MRSRPEPVPGVHAIDTGTVELEPQTGPPRHWLLSVNGVPSSTICPDDPAWLGFEYLQIMAGVLEATHPGRPLTALHLGAAGCALPWALHVLHPGSRQVAVDVDARLLSLVREWFDLPRSPALRLRAGEAREVLRSRRDASADLVVRDAFADDVTPPELRTVEFHAEVARVVRSGGLYLANLADRPPLSLLKDEIHTVATAFAHVAVIAETSVLRARRYGNLVMIGSAAPLPVARLHQELATTGLALRVVHAQRLEQLAAGGRPLRDENTSATTTSS